MRVPHEIAITLALFTPALLAAPGCKGDDGSAQNESETGDGDGDESETGDGDGDTIPEDAAWVEINLDAAVAEVDPRFLSYALDTDKVVSQGFDFDRPKLFNLTQALGPALLRIGGTKADIVYYDMIDDVPDMLPPGYEDTMTKSTWDAACAFAEALGVEMLFTINAGAGPRDDQGVWTDDQARALIEYTVAQGCPVSVWEFGNEIGAFGLEHNFTLPAADYAADFLSFAAAVKELNPEAKTAGPASMYWPVEGEIFYPVIPDLVEAAGDQLDILTWHYYPQQSSSCPTGTRIVDQPIPPLFWFDSIDVWAEEVEGYRDQGAPNAAVWLGETGHAQCGGEPGISDTFASSFWWLDQLGRVAKRGQPLMIRQALSGGAYKLIEDSNLEPSPDYYASWLWKHHMGTRVLDATIPEAPKSLRAYAHCDTEGPAGAVSVLVINFDASSPATLAFLDGSLAFEARVVTAQDVLATSVMVNEAPWQADAEGKVPTPAALAGTGALELPPLSYAFVRIPGAAAPACM